MAKAKVVNVIFNEDKDGAIVTYSTGTIKPYKNIVNLPKTALDWLEKQEKAMAKEEAQKKQESEMTVKIETVEETAIAEETETEEAKAEQPEPVRLPRPVIQPGPGAAETVMFGIMMIFAIVWFVSKNVAELLALAAGMLLIRLWSRRDDVKVALIEIVEAGSRWTAAACKEAVAAGAILVFMAGIAISINPSV